MSRKHNTKHRRALSNYTQRLADRGLAKSPMMKDYIGVEKAQRLAAGRAKAEARSR